MSKTICITGASSGLGYHMTGHFISKGYDIIATVRKEEDKKKLEELYGSHIIVLLMDIEKDDDISRASLKVLEYCKEKGLLALVNNAGIATSGPLIYLSKSELRKQFEVNVFGLLDFTQRIFSVLKGPKPGRIINISSVSGIITSPFIGAYSASKFALEALSDGLRREMKIFDIKVIIIQPGPIKTKIWKKNLHIAQNYKNTPYGPILSKAVKAIENTEKNALNPLEVSEVVIKAITSKRPKTRYIVAKRKWIYRLLSNFTPDRWTDKLLVRDKIKETDRTRPF